MSAGPSKDISELLAEQVNDALIAKETLLITGGRSKEFLVNKKPDTSNSREISTLNHAGIINYEPKELVLTARSGTPLNEVRAALLENKQMLAFEPPSFSDTATIGGTIACGLSGSRMPYAGSARDFVLGTRIINGHGESLHFGGEVMKNVAGYDVSRLMTGAMGTLGLLLDISLKVLPVPEKELTLMQKVSSKKARNIMIKLMKQYSPISGMSYVSQHLNIRLSGTESVVNEAAKKIGGEKAEDPTTFWNDLNNQHHPFFDSEFPLWRLSLPTSHSWHEVKNYFSGDYIVDWGGGLIWLFTDDAPDKIFSYVKKNGGHSQLFRSGKSAIDNRRQPLDMSVMNWHKKIKQSFDPENIFNPSYLYKSL